MDKQIFGFTPPHPTGDEYVRFLAVYLNGDGNCVFHVRNTRGVTNEIIVPRARAFELAAALTKHAKPETTI